MRVLVTGGAAGLGAALVGAFEARGDSVLVADVSVADGPSRIHLDVRSEEDWSAALSRVEREWGGLDVLVNNAGIAGGGRVELCTMAEWEEITAVNLFGVVRGTRTFVPIFKRQRSGHVVNVASLAGLVHPAGMGSYNAVKAGVVAFSETIGHELAAYDVKASVVCPSYFRTNLMTSMHGSDRAVGEVVAHMVESSPSGAADIAAAVLEGMARGDEVIVPDEAARRAVSLKQRDRAAYNAMMRAQAAKLDAIDARPAASRAASSDPG
ncbi:MAG: SDR family NAD(P)-dependent oxidoreductase [Actinomycetota bacterium]|nr:SDR family NAD(P)-dependent oxidoreductase [Actinomycetota bacterium]